MDPKPYLVNKQIINNQTVARPKYILRKIYSLFRPVTLYDRTIPDDPETRGPTIDTFTTETE